MNIKATLQTALASLKTSLSKIQNKFLFLINILFLISAMWAAALVVHTMPPKAWPFSSLYFIPLYISTAVYIFSIEYFKQITNVIKILLSIIFAAILFIVLYHAFIMISVMLLMHNIDYVEAHSFLF